jgi:hypothetical protein
LTRAAYAPGRHPRRVVYEQVSNDIGGRVFVKNFGRRYTGREIAPRVAGEELNIMTKSRLRISFVALVFMALGTTGCPDSQATQSRSAATTYDYSSEAARQKDEALDLAREREELEIEKLTERHRRELRQLKEKHEDEIKALKDSHAKKLADLRASHEAEIKRLTDQHGHEVEVLKASHRLQVEELEGRVFTFQMIALAAGVTLVAGWGVFLILRWRRGKHVAGSGAHGYEWESPNPPKAEAWRNS